MNTTNPPPDNDRLSSLLQSWQVETSLPPRFAEDVWRRIERRQQPGGNPLTTVGSWLTRLFREPRFALAYLALLVLVGSGAGLLQGRATSRQLASGLQGQYVRSIDPYAERAH